MTLDLAAGLYKANTVSHISSCFKDGSCSEPHRHALLILSSSCSGLPISAILGKTSPSV